MGILRKTQSLAVMLAEFDKSSHAISAIDLISRLSNKLNKTTVYRILDKLEDDGLLHSFLGKNGIKWYAKCNGCSKTAHSDVHPHFQCVECGQVDCLAILIPIPELPNRTALMSSVLIQGKCQNCS